MVPRSRTGIPSGHVPHRNKRRHLWVWRQHEREWQIGGLEAEALVGVHAEALKDMRMTRHTERSTSASGRLQRGKR